MTLTEKEKVFGIISSNKQSKTSTYPKNSFILSYDIQLFFGFIIIFLNESKIPHRQRISDIFEYFYVYSFK